MGSYRSSIMLNHNIFRAMFNPTYLNANFMISSYLVQRSSTLLVMYWLLLHPAQI